MKTEEWKIIFFIAAGFFFAGNLLFVIFGKAEIQPWNETEGDKNNTLATANDGNQSQGSCTPNNSIAFPYK